MIKDTFYIFIRTSANKLQFRFSISHHRINKNFEELNYYFFNLMFYLSTRNYMNIPAVNVTRDSQNTHPVTQCPLSYVVSPSNFG